VLFFVPLIEVLLYHHLSTTISEIEGPEMLNLGGKIKVSCSLVVSLEKNLTILGRSIDP
jgi:hypothetical protein